MKTTAIKKMVDFLESNGQRCQGFYTEEVLDGSSESRIGFDVVTIPDSKRGILSRKSGIKSKFKTGRYFVDVDSFESLALPSLSMKKDKGSSIVFILDEIGRMELHSTLFKEHVRNMLSADLRLVGAITAPIYGHRVPFCDEVSSIEGVHVYKLTKRTRESILESLEKNIESRWFHRNVDVKPSPSKKLKRSQS